MSSVTERRRRRRGLRWTALLALAFGYLLCLTWERVELKERNGRIEGLERRLQESRADAAYLTVQIDRLCSYAEVQRIARDSWGMRVAARDQCALIASDARTPAEEGMTSEHATIASRLGHALRDLVGVAQAHPAVHERGHGSTAR